MKNKLKLLVMLLVLTLALGTLTACTDVLNDLMSQIGIGGAGKVETVIIVSPNVKLQHVVLYDGESETAHNAANAFKDEMIERELATINFVYGTTVMNEDNEIIFGESNRAASKKAAEYVDGKNAKDPQDFHWSIAYADGKLAIVANSEKGYELALEELFGKYVKNKALTFKSDLSISGTLTLAQHEANIAEQERIEAEKKAEANRKLLKELLPLLDDQREELADFEGKINPYKDNDPVIKLFATYTKNVPLTSWGKTELTPSDEHPRLLVNKDMIPDIKAYLEEDNAFTQRFFEKLDVILENEGILPPAKNQGTNTTVNLDNVHNYSDTHLEVIQTKALYYLLYGEELYGYQAIYYMKNYLKSLEIEQIASDQCRQYGYVMYTAALVYDWCYDLLTDLDKTQFIAGVENCLCNGVNKKEKKMEVGFPPTGQGSVSGHGSEYQILRDYLAFATAIYGDNSSWWDCVAGRVYNDYVPVRNHYFQSGITHQGTGYATARHICDFYTAWIFRVATGTDPFVGMENTVRSLLGYEYAPGLMFNDGDGTGDSKTLSSFTAMAYMTAYLYADPAMLAQAEHLIAGKSFGSSFSGISNPAFIALTAMADIKPAEDRYEGMDLIQYNGAPLGQYVIREAWNSEDSVAVMMRIKERTTANHEHRDSGTFEICYKGALSTDGGCYNNYGHIHTQYFHQATISHNGLIIYNYNKASSEGGWYSGGQQRMSGEAQTLDGWLKNPIMDTGTVTGRQHGYVDGDPTKPLYAYIAGDISEAYATDTAKYVGRRMLTVFTGDEEYPMAFFVYDDITSANKNFEKRFLLQISSKTAPTIDTKEQTVITENGGGRLVLKCFSDDVVLNGVGGRNKGAFDATKSQNYLIEGKQLVPQSTTADDGHWGRVEIVYDKAASTATFMNLIYVTDKGNDDIATMKATSSDDGLTGAIFEKKIVALFATDRNRATATVSCKTTGSSAMDYYVSGLAEGKWTVTVDGKSIGTYDATAEGGMIVFKAPAGTVTVSPAK